MSHIRLRFQPTLPPSGAPRYSEALQVVIVDADHHAVSDPFTLIAEAELQRGGTLAIVSWLRGGEDQSFSNDPAVLSADDYLLLPALTVAFHFEVHLDYIVLFSRSGDEMFRFFNVYEQSAEEKRAYNIILSYLARAVQPV